MVRKRVENHRLWYPRLPGNLLQVSWEIFLAADEDWPQVVKNLRREWQKWARLTRVLMRKGAYACTLGHIYLAVVQLVIIYGSDIWVMTP